MSAISGRDAATRQDGRVPLFVVGCGGVGREALDVAIAAGIEVEGFLDDRPPESTVRGLAVRTPDTAPPGSGYLLGLADPHARRRLAELLGRQGLLPVSLVHPRAVIAPETTIGPGCLVMAGAHVSSSVTIGAHVQVQYNATIGHDARLDDFAVVLPGANISGAVHLGTNVMIGTGACVLQGRSVGADAVVGAGAVVVDDVDDATTVMGVPARTR